MSVSLNTFNNWIGGELSSETNGRHDIAAYDKGGSIIRNYLIQMQGPITYRPSFEFITNVEQNKKGRVDSFIFNDDLAYALEFTDKKLRFYRDAGLILTEEGIPYSIETPYLESDDLERLQIASTADIMVIVHPKYAPRRLTRMGETDWVLEEITGSNFPFTSEKNYPRAVTFAQGRIWYGGTENAIDKFWGSRGPDPETGDSRFDDFTTGVNDTDAVTFILAPPSGKVEAIEWIKSNNKFLLVGTFSGVSKVTGSSDEAAITPSSINVRQITDYGGNYIPAEALGSSVYYVQRNGLKLREIKYYLTEDAYLADDRNKISTEITGPGIKEIAYTQGEPDILWAARHDGVLIGMTTDKREDINAWHRHYLGGNGAVESITSVPRKGNPDQLYAIVRREINGETVRYMEYLTMPVALPTFVDFYTGNPTEDKTRWQNAVYQAQLEYRFLDSCVSYYGSDYATDKIDISSTSLEGEVTITSPSPLFEASWVGRQIWGKYDSQGVGGGRYSIKEVVSPTILIAQELEKADVLEIQQAEWYLTTDSLENINHLEGQEVGVLASGVSHPERVVTAGKIELDTQYHVVHVGLKYLGIFQTMDIELGGGIQGSKSTVGIPKKIQKVSLKLKDTIATKFGTSLYNAVDIPYSNTNQRLGRPPIPFTGIKNVVLSSGYNNGGVDDTETHFVVIQSEPQPSTIQVMNVLVDATNE